MLSDRNNIRKAHRIIVVDDDPILQVFLEDYLSQNGYHVSFASAGEDLQLLLEKRSVDLIILDILLPGKDGFYWLDWLHRNHAATKVIMLSVKDKDKDCIQGLESGAHDYLVKPFNPRELLARINNLLPPPQALALEFGKFRFEHENQLLTKDEQIIKLTNTELVLLICLTKKPKQVVTRDELAYALRGDTHNPLDRSIDVHINRLRGKIEDDPATPYFIRTVWGKGYLFHMG